MEEESVSVAWSWVIEALARSNLVDAALLYELCRSILHDTDMGVAAQEAAALTCLQSLYPSPKHDVPHSQFCLNPAHTCQHVLQRIWLETDNLQKDASDDLKLSVQTFVNHKKASFPNSTLQMLKDMILQGNHSVFKEISGLVFGDQCGLDVPFSKCDPMYPQSTSVNIPHPSETLCQQVNTCNPASEVDEQLGDTRILNTSSGQANTGINGSCIDNHVQGSPHPSETLRQQVNTCNPAPDVVDHLRDTRILNTSSGQSKTGVNGSCIDNHVQGSPHPSETLRQQVNTCNPASEVDDQFRDARIFNTSSEQSKTGINGSCIDDHIQGVDISASSDLDNVGPSAKKLKLDNQCGMPPKQQDSVSFDVTKFPGDMQDESNNSLTEANHTCGGESSEKVVAKNFKETEILALRSPANGGCHHHRTDAAMSKAIFSGSQCFFSDDSITLTGTEENLCMKCNKGGQLLSCCGSTCPLHFHETCIGCFVSFDDHGDFYCPVCAYSRAAADFIKAKERVSLARKELALFIGGGSNDQPKHSHNKSSDDDLDHQIHENGENVAALQDGATADAVQIARSH
ncbi:hypothetical protein KSS87_008968 [Heliosperma pusillum]|nr:hypothetical protein KSS87_008968 [Heliosperma pusillum]